MFTLDIFASGNVVVYRGNSFTPTEKLTEEEKHFILDKVQEEFFGEYSEEEIHSLVGIIDIMLRLNSNGQLTGIETERERERRLNELKTFVKSRLPLPNWKPTSEQMDALMDAINDSIMRYDYHGSPLKEEVTRTYSENLQSLYTQLKKL